MGPPDDLSRLCGRISGARYSDTSWGDLTDGLTLERRTTGGQAIYGIRRCTMRYELPFLYQANQVLILPTQLSLNRTSTLVVWRCHARLYVMTLALTRATSTAQSQSAGWTSSAHSTY